MIKFRSEAELCARFLSAIDHDKWTAYPETAGWDILLARKFDGFQIGIEAKLRLNATVIEQAIESGSHATERGPDARAIICPPYGAAGFETICRYIGVVVIRVREPDPLVDRRWASPFQPDLPNDREYAWDEWPEWCPRKRCELPAYVPDVQAGVKAPIRLTQWKIKAIKLCIILERNGYVTRDDFKHLKLDHRLWISVGKGWLIAKDGRYIAAPGLPALKKQHPRNWVEIEADAAQWMPAANVPTLL